ncbi:MAG: single-stranded DNA-binding protein [Lachnospiraceae bacterium]|nr:single-stranded DNA-binding protein [Lachnospiraceae bacterium]
MNKVILMGRLTRDPEIRYTQGDASMVVARYTLAVNRYRKVGGEQQADFVSCVVFRKGAEFAEKYLHQGVKILVSGQIRTGSYVNKDGQKVYTTEIVVTEQEFAEKKAVSPNVAAADEGFMNIQADIDGEGLPFQ